MRREYSLNWKPQCIAGRAETRFEAWLDAKTQPSFLSSENVRNRIAGIESGAAWRVGQNAAVKYWEIIADKLDNLSRARL
jgi:hypothetical protein